MSEQCPKCGQPRQHGEYACGSWLNRGNNDALVQSDLCRRRELERQVASLEAERDRLRTALNHLASWGEGERVNGTFDAPDVAQYARDVLKAVDGTA